MTRCDRRVGHDRRLCRRPARYSFRGDGGHPLNLCVLHSGAGYLSEGALPGWVQQVVDLREKVR